MNSKAVINAFLSFLLCLTLTATLLCAAATMTVLSWDCVSSALQEAGFIEAVNQDLEARYRKLLANTGVSDDFIASLVISDVGQEFLGKIGSLYGATPAPLDREAYQAFLCEKIYAQVLAQGGEEGADTEAIATSIAQALLEKAEAQLSLPGSGTLSTYRGVLASLCQTGMLFGGLLSLVLIAFLIWLNARRPRGLAWLTASGWSVVLLTLVGTFLWRVSRPLANLSLSGIADRLLLTTYDSLIVRLLWIGVGMALAVAVAVSLFEGVWRHYIRKKGAKIG